MPRPCWYVPDGMQPPAHIDLGGGAKRVLAGKGPDRATNPQAGGLVYGGGPVPPADDPRWRKAPGGWWFSIGGCLPGDFARMHQRPGFVVDLHVDSASDSATQDQRLGLLIPHLLQPGSTGGFVSAVKEVFNGQAWVSPAWADALQHDLRAAVDWDGKPDSALSDAEVMALVERLVQVNYHLSLAELGDRLWLDASTPYTILFAACGIEAGHLPAEPEA